MQSPLSPGEAALADLSKGFSVYDLFVIVRHDHLRRPTIALFGDTTDLGSGLHPARSRVCSGCGRKLLRRHLGLYLSCEKPGHDAQGYSFKFPSIVKDGVLHAEKGTKGKPGWLQLDGKLQTDGSAKIYADGLVGAAEAAVGHRPVGTEYGYHIEARFSANSGTGRRVEGRSCSVTFARKR